MAINRSLRAHVFWQRTAPIVRYFFNIRDGAEILDGVGSEHSDLAGVRLEALEATTELVKGRLLADTDTSAWIVQVTDETGITVMVLSLAASIHILSPVEKSPTS